MKAIQFDRHGPPNVLELVQLDAPIAGRGQVQIRVAAAGVNPADYKWRNGANLVFAKLPLPFVPGMDVAGEVTAVRDGVSGFAVGDRVLASVRGGYAEVAVANGGDCAIIPAGVDFVQAAALPTSALTGVQMIEEGIAPSAKQTVLVTGATGGVGRFAAWAVRKLGGKVIAAVRGKYMDEARAMGLDQVVDLGSPVPEGLRFDHVADTVGGADVARFCRNLIPGGKIITVATTPTDPEGLAAQPTMFGLHFDGALLARILDGIANGEVAMPVAATFPLADAAGSHALLEPGGVAGRVVLTV